MLVDLHTRCGEKVYFLHVLGPAALKIQKMEFLKYILFIPPFFFISLSLVWGSRDILFLFHPTPQHFLIVYYYKFLLFSIKTFILE